MKRLVLLLGLAMNLSSAFAADYRGSVGKLEAVFSLEWHDDGSVSGLYSHPSRPGVRYSLEGSNPAEGELYLEEYTGNTLSARCYLSKSVRNGVIVWSGEMRNTDGRVLPMQFARTRDAAPVPAPVPVAVAENAYVGFVGRLEARFQLSWQSDGTVNGSYHYPDRSGTTYTLLGNNPREGELYLSEFTDGLLSARCVLHKRLEEGLIIWEGRMTNVDGRHFAMAFARERNNAAPAVAVDTYEARRHAVFGAFPGEQRWDDFPLADEVIERVPVDLEEGQYFGARVHSCVSDGIGTTLQLRVADWDVDGKLLVEQGRDLRLRVARVLPFPEGALEDRDITLLFDREGLLFSLELPDIAITHVRRTASGKLEVRGLVDLFPIAESQNWREEEYLEKMLSTEPIEFLPDKLALDLVPFDEPDPVGDEIVFQTIRLVRDYGLSIQATAAGPGSLELESVSLDPGPPANPWIPLMGLKEAIKAPPAQATGQAG